MIDTAPGFHETYVRRRSAVPPVLSGSTRVTCR